jgi:P4 family phage/plasmid primase-like protien
MPDPRPGEFRRFHELLTAEAPDGYTPWYFRCRSGSKAPQTTYGSWKDEGARLNVDEAVQWMERGGNVGIAGTEHDALVNVDIDDEDETQPGDLKDTLIARSRSRTGRHAWYFAAPDTEIPNIPTDDAGEVRTEWQYVVAPGSYVETDADDVPVGERDDAGYYTVEHENRVTSLRYDELPSVFREHHEETEQASTDAQLEHELPDPDPAESDGDRSALFEITAEDVVRKEGGSTDTDDRWSALFHGSDTDANMSVSSQGLIQCWRHNVTHNGLQALVVLSDYSAGCERVGAPHTASSAGASCLQREDGAHIWAAWVYAKRNGYLPDDDPVPYNALRHLCRKRDLCAVSEIPEPGSDDTIPASAYNNALRTIREHDELDPGRETTDNIADGSESDETEPEPDGDQPTSTEADTGSDDADGDDWGIIRQLLREAEDADDRARPRFRAAMKLLEDHDFLTLSENDQLYAYEGATGTFSDDGETVVRSELTEGLQEQYRAHAMREALDHIRGRTIIPKDEIGGPPGYVAAENCVIDLDDGEAREHSPEYRFLSRLGCAYDPDVDAPRFRAFLKQVVPKESDRKKLQEYAGYTLMHWALPYHKALFLVGPTASGKSTFLDTINAMLGADTVASLTPQQLTTERFSGAELFEKWANIRNDIPAATVENTGMFKEIIGGDPMKAERKRKDPFMFEPTAKHLFAANELPSTETDDEAFYRRILLVPFPETVPAAERDKHLDDKLQAELPGVLNWALTGYDRLRQQGGFTADRTPGQTQETWQKWADSVSRFESAALVEGDDAIAKSDVYAAYIEYCRQEGIPSDTQHSMTRSLKLEGYEDGRTYVDGDRQRVFLQTRLSSRGKELLEDARSETSDETESRRRDNALGEFE